MRFEFGDDDNRERVLRRFVKYRAEWMAKGARDSTEALSVPREEARPPISRSPRLLDHRLCEAVMSAHPLMLTAVSA